MKKKQMLSFIALFILSFVLTFSIMECGSDKAGKVTEDKIEKPDYNEDTPTTSAPVEDPYVNVSKEEFYANYKPATSLEDARYRSKHGFLSGSLEVPGQYAQDAKYQPKENEKFIRNTSAYYLDNGNTYVVVD